MTDHIFDEATPRVITIEAPPRHGKSEYTSHWLPSWYLSTHPDHKLILCSYAESLARSFGRRCRDTCQEWADWFALDGISADVSGQAEWQIRGHDGGMMCAGVGGPITGRGANFLIVDDPLKNAEEAISQRVRDGVWEWFTSTAWTRLEPGGLCVVMMTRWHEDDLVGRIKTRAAEDLGVDVTSIVLPALAYDQGPDLIGRQPGEPLWPERWPLDALKSRRSMLSAYWWQSLYQQRPGQYGKSEWPTSYFESPFWCDVEEWPDRFEASCIFVDPSKGTKRGDFAGIVFLGLARGKMWIDSVVDRLPVEEIALAAYQLYDSYGADRVGIEDNAFQFLLERVFDDLVTQDSYMPLPLSLIHNHQNKEQIRIPRLGPYLRKHQFRFLRSPGNARLVGQLKSFPYGDHDDGPDAMESALRVLRFVLSVDETDAV